MIINMSTYKNCNEYKEKINNNNNHYNNNIIDNTNNKLKQSNYINNFKNEIRGYLLEKGSRLIYVLQNEYENSICFENLVGNDKQVAEVLRRVEGVFGNRVSIFLADLEIKKTTCTGDHMPIESNNLKLSLDNIIDSSNIQVIGLFSDNIENNYPILPINSLNNIQFNNKTTTKVILICKN